MANVLIVHAADRYPMRESVRDHLYSFRRYSGHNCFYLNLAARDVPRYLASVPFDLVIFHTTFLSTRWSPELFRRLREKAAPLKRLGAAKAALPQDEFIHTDALCDFINEFGVDLVFTVAPESEWPKIYRKVDFRRVKFFYVLTGYMDERAVKKIDRLARAAPPRDIDIGYRAWRAAPWLGRHGLLKVRIADVFLEQAAAAGLVADISTREEDTILGDRWYDFLLRCKYSLGVEGGASLLDHDGAIKRRTEEYLARHPQATFEEIERACFPGLDGTLQLMALAPRNLEACATRTCQVLVEGHYNGVLKPGEHYIELKRDFSNVGAVIDLIRRDDVRREIAERAYRDVIESGRYSYRSFVRFVTEESLRGAPAASAPPAQAARARIVRRRMQAADASVLLRMWVRHLRGRLQLRTRARRVLGALPGPLSSLLVRSGRARNV